MRTLSKPLIVIALFTLLAACQKGGTNSVATVDESASATPIQQASPLTDFEKSLQFIRNGQYTYVWVFSRKDGKPLDSEDSQYLRTNAPQVVDWVTTQDKKKVIGGTNFNLEEGNLGLLRKRFVAEDYSRK